MIFKNEPFYTYNFGSMGRTSESAVQTEFFRWFHMEATDKRAEEPGRSTTYRPSGEKFHNLCSLETLESTNGDLVQMELVIRRSFLDGADRLFAQDLVKSFLVAILPEACQHLLEDFMSEIQTLDMTGRAASRAPGWRVFRGQQTEWSVQTGWSRLALTNVELPEGSSLVVRVSPNPKAPNAMRVGGAPCWRAAKLLAFLGLAAVMLSSCSKPAPLNPEVSLKGAWKTTLQRVNNCGKPTPLALQDATFEIQDAPLLNRAASSFNLEDANVTGTIAMSLRMEPNRPHTVTTGLLVGEVVKDASSGTKLQGYILSQEEYGAWVARKKQGPAPPDAGEVELNILGDAVHGYRLAGEVRSSEACSRYTQLDAVARDLSGEFGRGVPAEWTVVLSMDRR